MNTVLTFTLPGFIIRIALKRAISASVNFNGLTCMPNSNTSLIKKPSGIVLTVLLF